MTHQHHQPYNNDHSDASVLHLFHVGLTSRSLRGTGLGSAIPRQPRQLLFDLKPLAKCNDCSVDTNNTTTDHESFKPCNYAGHRCKQTSWDGRVDILCVTSRVPSSLVQKILLQQTPQSWHDTDRGEADKSATTWCNSVDSQLWWGASTLSQNTFNLFLWHALI